MLQKSYRGHRHAGDFPVTNACQRQILSVAQGLVRTCFQLTEIVCNRAKSARKIIAFDSAAQRAWRPS